MLPFKNVLQLQRYFNTELKCAQYIEEQRWGGKPVCPHCGCENLSRTKTRLLHVELEGYKDFRCKGCDKKFSVLTGTFYESSKVELKTWFAAIYLMSSHKKGISSLQLHRDLGITQKTAWFMLHRIRKMFSDVKPEVLLQNEVQIDETYVGGKNKNRHNSKKVKNSQGRSTKDKTPVVGMYEKNGEIRTMVVNNTNAETLETLIENNIDTDATIVTDGFKGYSKVGEKREHKIVDHASGIYVIENQFHTNNVENFWSMLKRGIVGIYHSTSKHHLHRYCDEFAYRYNTRRITDMERFDASMKRVNGRLSYAQLIGA